MLYFTAGYYTIEQKSKKYRIISLNTNLWLNPVAGVDNRVSQHHQSQRTGATIGTDNTDDPHNQWTWFECILRAAKEKKEKVSWVIHYWAISFFFPGVPLSVAPTFSLGFSLHNWKKPFSFDYPSQQVF